MNLLICMLTVYVVMFQNGDDTLGEGALGSGSSSGMGFEPIDDGLREFITYEITRGILDVTPVMFGSIKEGIMELMEDRLQIFRVDMDASQSGARTLPFKDLRERGAPDFFRVKDPIAARHWIADTECA